MDVPYLLPDSLYDLYDLYDPGLVELPPSVAETFEGEPPVQRNHSAHRTFGTMPLEVTRKLIGVCWGTSPSSTSRSDASSPGSADAACWTW